MLLDRLRAPLGAVILIAALATVRAPVDARQAQQSGQPPAPPTAPAGTIEAGSAAPATVVSWDEWLAGVRAEALTRGIRPETVASALDGLAPLSIAVERDRTQPEETLSLDSYVARYLTPAVVRSARAVAAEHQTLLARVGTKYGVPQQVLVAVWGLESNFGKFTGTHPVVATLATLAYDARRPTLFRSELFSALAILDRDHLDPGEMNGSWAGAMGQPQFMPSSYLKYAVDFDGDGRADIWSTPADVFASVANYLEAAGWTPHQRWGREVRLTRAAQDRVDRDVPMRASGCKAVRELTEPRSLAAWQRLGVRLPNGGALPHANLSASLVRGDRRFFLVYRNYDAILGYNCANAYAVSVGLLADAIGG